MVLKTLRETTYADLRLGSERSTLIRSTGAVAAIKACGIILAFGASLLYARALGPHGYGLYAYILAWVAVLSVPVGLGLPQYLMREGAKRSDTLQSLTRWSNRPIIVSGAVAAIIMATTALLPEAADARWLFVVAAPLPLLNSLTAARSGLLQGRGRIADSQWPTQLLGPFTMLAVLALLWGISGRLKPMELVITAVITACMPLVINELQVRHSTPQRDTVHSSIRLRDAFPFMWLGGLLLINNRTDLLLLGAIKGAHSAGIYAISARAADLVAFFFNAANIVLAPRIAQLSLQGDHGKLQRLLGAAARRVLLLTIPVALLFIFGAYRLLTSLYGASYSNGTAVLQILTAAQLLNVAIGPTGTVLTMTGHEKLTTLSIGLALVLNVALNIALIPRYDILGAAIATGISLTTWNIALWYWIRRHLGLRPTGVGI